MIRSIAASLLIEFNFLAHFIVTQRCENGYEIIYNLNRKGYIAKASPFVFKSWEEYLMELPLGAALKNDMLEFEIAKVIGDSLLTVDKNWRRWRDGEQLLIEFHFLM